jgi:hypothetical protein
LGSIGRFDEHGDTDHGGEAPEFIAAVNDLIQRIRSSCLFKTGAFVGASVWSIGRKGLMIESVPGLLFLWLVFDIFLKLHAVGADKPESLS